MVRPIGSAYGAIRRPAHGSAVSRQYALRIAPVCTALTTMIIYFACIVAYPASFGKKLLGLLLGIPALALVNFGRLLLLGYLGYTNQRLFDLVHLYVFQVVFIVFVIVMAILLPIFDLNQLIK